MTKTIKRLARLGLLPVALVLAFLLAALPPAAHAQSNPGLITGQVPTAAQWNSYFSAKLDFSSTQNPTTITVPWTFPSVQFTLQGSPPANPPAGVGAIFATSSGFYGNIGGTIIGPFATATSGSVTSVGLTMPAGFGVSGSPITGAGTLGVTWNNQSDNYVLAGPCSGAAAAPTFRPLCAADVPANIRVRSFGTTFGDTTATSALTSGSVVYFHVPYACTISAWNITVDAGTVTFDIWKVANGTVVPTSAASITASALPALSTGSAVHSTTLTGWTTAVAANDIVGIQLNTVATAKFAQIDIECDE